MDALLLLLQLAVLLLGAPLLQGLIKTSKARWQGRRGPHPLQPWRDIRKLLGREQVVSDQASWLFRWAPAVYAGATLTAAVLVPTVARRPAAPGLGDVVVFVGLLALARFALALAGLDTASNFGGMGSSREVAFAALVEPALLLVLIGAALPSGSTAFGALVGDGRMTPAALLALGALLIVIIAETGRVPIDNPDTHLELTMIHEGMLLEYSGRQLGILHWASQIKQMTMLSLMAALFLPWGMASDRSASALAVGLAVYAFKLGLLGLLLGAIESAFAKLRILRAPDLIGVASVLGVLAVVATFAVGS